VTAIHNPFLPEYFQDFIKRTPEEWLTLEAYKDYLIMDPDGWRGADAPDWNTPLNRKDFEARLFQCTLMKKSGGWL
jgi:hypothetical protein